MSVDNRLHEYNITAGIVLTTENTTHSRRRRIEVIMVYDGRRYSGTDGCVIDVREYLQSLFSGVVHGQYLFTLLL